MLGAVSVATACVIPGSIAAEFSAGISAEGGRVLDIEHPTGFFSVDMVAQVSGDPLKPEVVVSRSALLRTARKLMGGSVFVPASLWEIAP
ncbi:PrpF domain-containing protein [Elstera litoralis]|uniref:PrpF domain-containing protein n=1 Tax=Elstera litoralis TaxID=552518 RepID=UPI0022B6E14D|nr:PrpF domain-containing protein [Elstera litoralis]